MEDVYVIKWNWTYNGTIVETQNIPIQTFFSLLTDPTYVSTQRASMVM